MEELWRLSLERMADELENPSNDEHPQRDRPETGDNDGQQEQWNRERDERDTDGVAESVDAILVTLGVLGDPVRHRPAAEDHEMTARSALISGLPSSMTVTWYSPGGKGPIRVMKDPGAPPQGAAPGPCRSSTWTVLPFRT